MSDRAAFEAAATEPDAHAAPPPSDNAAMQIALDALRDARDDFRDGIVRMEGMTRAMRALATPRSVQYSVALSLVTLAGTIAYKALKGTFW